MKRILLSFLGLYVIYGAVMVFLHTSLLYPFFANDTVLSGFERIDLTASDGTQVSIQEAKGEGPVVVYFMGNAGALAAFALPLRSYAATGRHIIAMEYRGGARRPGRPSEAVLKSDALMVAEWALAKGKPVVIHGYSLGTGLAMHVAAQKDVAQVILEAPYDRLCTLMTQRSALPACYLPGVQKWDTLTDAGHVTAPVLILHGEDDAVIPSARSTALAERLPNAKRLVNNNAGHLDVFAKPEAQRALKQVFDRLN